MAESDSILQLGIEAARDGNKEEARNLFRLLTRQEPQNTQAWLWLAGVAENREERQAALEHVVELDPNNEMAIRGLQALGVSPPHKVEDTPDLPQSSPPEAPEDTRDRYVGDEDDQFAALDSLSEAMNESPDAVRRSRSATEAYESPAWEDRHAEPSRAGEGRPFREQSDRYEEEEEETEPARGVNPLLLGLVILAFIILLAVVFWPQDGQFIGFGSSNSGEFAEPVEDGGATTDQSPALGTEGETVPGQGDAAQGEGSAATGEETSPEGGEAAGETTPSEGEAVAEEGTPAEGEAAPEESAPSAEEAQPGEEAAPTQETTPADLADVDPTVVSPGTPLQSNGWQYNFSQPNYATSIVGGLGDIQPQGRFVLVLVFVTNTTGQTQPLPADFFVLKDAQGRVYNALPQASTAYLNLYGRGLAADLSHEDAVPADNLIRSIPILFDVEPDATNVKFFARSNPDQGWLVLQNL